MNRDIERTFKEKLYECQRHVEKITVSRNHLASIMPLSVESYFNLNDIDMSFTGLFILNQVESAGFFVYRVQYHKYRLINVAGRKTLSSLLGS